MKLLQDKVCIVTGAGRGIGRAIALRAADEGCRTVLAARSEGQLEAVRAEIESRGGQACPFRADLSEQEDQEALVARTLDRFGTIDFLVNNAGWGTKANIPKARVKDWDQTLRVNLLAPMILSQLVLPTLMAKQSGAIVNISSISGRAGQGGSAAYAASKAGLIAFSQALFEEVREHNVKVAAILPGFVDTDMIPPVRHLDRSRMIQAEDIAEAVLFVLTAPLTACPVEITVRPQRTPYR
ncbi:MAG: SDR family NAD(P)-dependent oxidoreductase [Deltaproteobacteria bacterium]|nr:SDR family NAD(P)-dependent oxidoreductase [Deltaproteobacteria bacterium]